MSAMKRCMRCGWELAVEVFARDASKASGHKSICKACDRAKSRRYYAANRERILARYPPALPRELVCAAEGCSNMFVATNGRQVHCEPVCRPIGDRGATVEAVCEGCGEPFEARARDVERGWGRFCKKSCSLRARTSPAVLA